MVFVARGLTTGAQLKLDWLTSDGLSAFNLPSAYRFRPRLLSSFDSHKRSLPSTSIHKRGIISLQAKLSNRLLLLRTDAWDNGERYYGVSLTVQYLRGGGCALVEEGKHRIGVRGAF